MNILFIVLGVIIAVILFLLFCPAVLSVVYDGENVTLKAGYIFPFIKIIPKMNKEEKPKKQKESDSENEKPSNKEKKVSFSDFTGKRGLGGLIDLLKSISEIALRTVKTITKHLVISKLNIQAVVVGEDPADTAMKFGYACSAVYPLVAIIDKNVKKCSRDINIFAGFNEKETKILFELKARIVPIFPICAAFSALFGFIKAYVKLH